MIPASLDLALRAYSFQVRREALAAIASASTPEALREVREALAGAALGGDLREAIDQRTAGLLAMEARS